MAHNWDLKPNRHSDHTVKCQLCLVVVERIIENGRGVNYHTLPGEERQRGLAPKCPGVVEIDEPAIEEPQVDVYAEAVAKYAEMSTKELYRLAAGRVKNYKKLRKTELVDALARADETEARFA